MRFQQLQHAVERPEVQTQALGGYEGPFSLGVGGSERSPVVVLQVPDTPPHRFPEVIWVDGEEVQLVVRTGYRQPNAYAW